MIMETWTVAYAILITFAQSASLEQSYIVKLKGKNRVSLGTHIKAVKKLFTGRSKVNKINNVFSELGPLYHATLSDSLVRKVRSMSDVEYVEVDKIVNGSRVQYNSPWGLARISQRIRPNKNWDYHYSADGAGVTVYVMDSGILVEHPEFEGRARFGARFISDNDYDENGHGTHCAGTIGSKTFGVAKKVNMVALKVFDESNTGLVSGMIAGINWAIGDKEGVNGNVINMSLGTERSQAFNDAVRLAARKGFVVIAASGNENQDACAFSPSSESSAITVGATDFNDVRAPFSNYGPCVDLYGPGVDIPSPWNDGEVRIASGTSMAAPHVAGLAACFLSQAPNPPSEIKARILGLASRDLISDSGPETPNLLTYSGYFGI